MSLQDKVAIITGASKGLGAAIAKELSSQGCVLCLTGRDEKALEKTKSACQAVGIASKQPLLVTGDLTDESTRKSVVECTLKTFKKIDILVNNAGIMQLGSFQDSSLQLFDNIFDINFRVPYDLCRLCLPHLVETKGCIINMSSIVSVRPNYTVTAYSISKAALDQLTVCLASELGPKQVRVLSIHPGVIDTDLWKIEGFSEEECERFQQGLKSSHALKRIGKAEEVSRVVAFLVSDGASFMTGSKVLIDGGMMSLPPQG